MIPNTLLAVVIRFIHIGSAAGLAGGVLYARVAALPALGGLGSVEQTAAAQSAQTRYRSTLFTLLVLIVLSGIYNYVTGQPHGTQWQMWFGIKMLFVLHFVATAIMWATSPIRDAAAVSKGKRRLAGMVISGFLAILVANYLHYLTLNGR